jgi:hypothetical protein
MKPSLIVCVPFIASSNILASLEKAFLFVLVTIYTKPMNWFALCHRWLEGVNKRTRWDGLKFVAFFLSIPFFEASHFSLMRQV